MRSRKTQLGTMTKSLNNSSARFVLFVFFVVKPNSLRLRAFA
jgi:hypothetical protein